MSWLKELFFARRTAAEDRAALYADWLRDERENKESALRNVVRMAQQLAAKDDVIAALRAQLAARQPERASIALLREELEKQKRVNDRLSNQLLDATGHNSAPLSAAAREKLGLPAEVKP